MLGLCGFADEISPDLNEQIHVSLACGVRRIELRSVEGVNVLDLDQPTQERTRSRLCETGLAVACIASPIGKVKITEPWEKHFERFKIAVELAEFFGAKMIRLFSYYPPRAGIEWRREFRDEVMRRMRAKVEYITGRDIVLVHENEAQIYGERFADCLDLLRTIDSPEFRCAFDFANFILAGDAPAENWPALKPFVAHFHIKDARFADHKIVPAGQGDGQIGPVLADAYGSGYRGLLSLEPHLSAAGQFAGFSGPRLFRAAVEALCAVCESVNVPLENARGEARAN